MPGRSCSAAPAPRNASTRPGKLVTQRARAAARAVGGADPRPPSRLHHLGGVLRPTPPGCARTGGRRAARRRRRRGRPRRCCRACCAAAAAGGSCRPATPGTTAATARATCAPAPSSYYAAERGCQQHRRRAAGEDHPGRAVRRAGARRAGSHRQGAGRSRRAVPGSGWPPSSSPSNAPATRPAAPSASTTPSSRRTGWSPAPWNAPGRTSWPPSGSAEARPGAPSRPANPSPSPSEELAWISSAGADIRAVFERRPPLPRERKQLIRAVIAEVVAHHPRARQRVADLRIIWQGGAVTELYHADDQERRPHPRHQRGHRRRWSAVSPSTTTTRPSR